MNGHSWISILHHLEGHSRILENCAAYESLLLPPPHAQDHYPVLVVLIGGTTKSTALQYFSGGSSPSCLLDRHGEIRLVCNPKARAHVSPLVYADCELHATHPSHWDSTAQRDSAYQRRIPWFDARPSRAFRRQQQRLSFDLYSHVLFPFASVVCLFADDFGGLRAVAETLAELAFKRKHPDLPQASLPRVVIVSTATDTRPERLETNSGFVDRVIRAMQAMKGGESYETMRFSLHCIFHSFDVLHWIGHSVQFERHKGLLDEISQLAREAERERVQHCRLFSLRHFTAFVGCALDGFIKDPAQPLRLVASSRARLGSAEDFPDHLGELLAKSPSQAYLWEVVVPLTASALILDSCPPGMHCMSRSITVETLQTRR